MKLSKTSQISVVLLMLSIISNCANITNDGKKYETPQKSHQLTDISHLTDREKADLYEAIIAADLAAANAEYVYATSYYLSAARLSKSIDLIQLSIQTAQQSDDHLAILQAVDMWLVKQPDNTEALSLKIGALLSQRDIAKAVSITEKLFEQQKDLTEQSRVLDERTLIQPPSVTNEYYRQLSIKYPQSAPINYATAAFFARFAKHSKNPAVVTQQAFIPLDKSLSIKADFIPSIELKTKLLFLSRQDQKAEAFLRKSHAEFPDSQQINQLLGQLLYDLRKYDLAEQHYLSWLKNNPNDTEARFFLTASYFANSKYKASLEQSQKILGKDYKPQMAYFFCGNSAIQIKQYAQAIACYDLIDEGKYLTSSKIELAKVYLLTGKIDKALATVRNPKYASDENTQVQLINLEVEILDRHVSKNKAKQRLAAALKNYPDNMSLLFRKIKIEELSDKPEQLVELLQKAEKNVLNEKNKHQFNLSVANLLRSNNHYQQAVDWLNKALIESPDDKEYLYARALYKEPLGLFDEMISDFKHLLSLDPQNVNIKNALGYTLVDVNQELEYAEQLIEQAYLVMPNNAAVIDSKGWLAYRKGTFPQAIQLLSKAFKMSPSADVATHIGEVYWKSGDKEKAMQYWIKAKSLDEKNYLLLSTVKRFGVELQQP